jgi:hypothetical protein
MDGFVYGIFVPIFNKLKGVGFMKLSVNLNIVNIKRSGKSMNLEELHDK